MYIVIQQAIYRHAIKGLYDDLDVAKSRAINVIAEEPDHHHGAAVLEIEPNKGVCDATVVIAYKYNTKMEHIEVNNEYNIQYDEGGYQC